VALEMDAVASAAAALYRGEDEEDFENILCSSRTELAGAGSDGSVSLDDRSISESKPTTRFASGASRRYDVSKSNTCCSTRRNEASSLRLSVKTVLHPEWPHTHCCSRLPATSASVRKASRMLSSIARISLAAAIAFGANCKCMVPKEATNTPLI
jgi:hypothetical protein